MLLSKVFSGVSRSLTSSVRSVSSWQATALKFSETGSPDKVLHEVSETVSAELDSGSVAIKWLAAPINPSDVYTVEGTYAIRPPMPAVAGNEGVAKVLKVGSGVKNVKVGDHVVPASAAIGTWRTHAVVQATEIMKVAADLPIIEAATLTVNPCTAWRMLYDFTSLAEGDTIIQNAANSAVGQAVIQIAAHKKWKTVNIIRDRPNKAETVKFLTDMGATHVITEADFRKRDVMKNLPIAKLGLNAVGGKTVADITKLMANGSTLVTYGGLSGQPMLVPTTALLFRDLILAGFWITKWNQNNSMEERIEMFDNVVHLMKKKILRPPVLEPVLLKDHQKAIKRYQDGFSGTKQLFVMDDETLATVKQELKGSKTAAA